MAYLGPGTSHSLPVSGVLRRAESQSGQSRRELLPRRNEFLAFRESSEEMQPEPPKGGGEGCSSLPGQQREGVSLILHSAGRLGSGGRQGGPQAHPQNW